MMFFWNDWSSDKEHIVSPIGKELRLKVFLAVKDRVQALS
jgi:hypothetical protein